MIRQNYTNWIKNWNFQLKECDEQLIWLERETTKALINLLYTNNYPKNIRF